MSVSRRTFLALSGAAASARAVPALAGSAPPQPGRSQNGSLPTLPRARSLEAADLSALNGDEQTLLVTLQGLVNRKEPRLYFYWGTDTTNLEWLQTIPVPHRISTDPWEFLARYRGEIRGAVVYDADVPDSINVATALASAHGGVIATSALAKAHQLPVLDDLTGRFTDTLSAYEWARANVWRKLSDRILTAIAPSNTVQVPNVNWTTLLKESRPIMDASNRAVYTADLSGLLGGAAVYLRYTDAVTSDGWGPSVARVTVTADGQTIASFTPGTDAERPFLFEADGSQIASGGWRFADGNNSFIYRFAPPAGTKQLTLSTEVWNEFVVSGTNTAPSVQQANPNFRDYIVATRAPVFWLDPEIPDQKALFTDILKAAKPNTPYLGWFPLGHEMTGVTLCSQYASPVVAADFLNNASVFAGVRDRVDATVPKPPKTGKVENKIYLTMTMVEGDNVQYDQHHMRMLWDDSTRGSVPLNWSVSVLCLDIAPSFLAYYQRTRTENDLLMAAPSGTGYTYPAEWTAAAFERFTENTGIYMRRTGMSTLFVYNRNGETNLPLSPEIVASYQRNVPGLEGIVLNYDPTSVTTFTNGLPIVTLLGINDVNSGKDALTQIAAGWDGKAPLFVAAGIESYGLSPTDAKAIADSLSSRFEVVRGDAFFQLLRGTQG